MHDRCHWTCPTAAGLLPVEAAVQLLQSVQVQSDQIDMTVVTGPVQPAGLPSVEAAVQLIQLVQKQGSQICMTVACLIV